MSLKPSRKLVRARSSGMQVGGFKMAANKTNKARFYSSKDSRKLKGFVRSTWNRSIKQSFDFYNLKFVELFKSRLSRRTLLDRKMVEALCSAHYPFLLVNPTYRTI
jgi:ribosomal protein L20